MSIALPICAPYCSSTPAGTVMANNVFDHQEVWRTAIECFSISAAASFFNQIREPHVPSWRVCIATCFYTGASAVAFVMIWVNYYGVEHTGFLYFTAIASGLGSTNMLTALWSKVIPACLNFIWFKTTGSNLISADEQLVPQPPAGIPPQPLSPPPPVYPSTYQPTYQPTYSPPPPPLRPVDISPRPTNTYQPPPPPPPPPPVPALPTMRQPVALPQWQPPPPPPPPPRPPGQ